VLSTSRASGIRYVTCRDNPSYHPGRCAEIFCGDKRLGVMGQLHPLTAENYGLDCEVYCAEIDFPALASICGEVPVYKALPKFPAVTRDLAVVCREEISVGELTETIMASGGKFLRECKFFDVYAGAPIAHGHKSVAFALTLRADDQSLTGEQAEETIQSILTALEKVHGAVIR